MLPDLRLLLAAMAVTILLVMKLGSNIVATAPDPYIGLSDVAQVRRSVVPQALPDNPEQRQLQTLAVSRRIDELHRLLDLPGGTVTFTDKSSDASGTADLVNPTMRPAYAPPADAALPARQDADSVVLAPEQRDGIAAGPPGTVAELPRDVTGSIATERDNAAPGVVVLAPESSEVAPDKQSPPAGLASNTADTPNAAAQPTPPPQPALSLRRSRGHLDPKEAHPAVRKKLAVRKPAPGTQVPKPNTDNPFSAMFGNNQ